MSIGLILAAAAQAGAACAEDMAHYEVEFVREREFAVAAQFVEPQTGFVVWHQPTEERPEGQAGSIRNLAAFDAEGRAVDIAYEGGGRWTAQEGAHSIRYTIVVDHDRFVWPHGADEVGHPFDGGYFFAGTAFFVSPTEDRETCPVSVTFEAPEGWTLTAPWATGGLKGRAPTVEDFQVNGFAVGPYRPSVQRVGDFALTSVYERRLADVVQSFGEELLEGLLPAYTDYFGGQPASGYSTFHFAYGSSDGSAFRQSFTLQYEWPLNDVEKPAWARALAHETMHLWIGAEGIRRADHQIEWFTEGFSDYLSIKHLYRAGFMDDEELRQQLGGVVTRHQLGSRLSGGTSLRDAGLEKGRNWFLIYGGGGLIAFVLDAEMSRAAPGSFDRMMAALYANRDEPYSFERLMSVMDAHSEGRASEIFNAVDAGMRHNQINERTRPAGVGVAGFVDTTYVVFDQNCDDPRGCAPAFLRGGR